MNNNLFLTTGNIVNGNFSEDGVWLQIQLKSGKTVKRHLLNEDIKGKLERPSYDDVKTLDEYHAIYDNQVAGYIGIGVEILQDEKFNTLDFRLL